MKLFAGFGRRHVLIALGFSFVVELAHLSYAWLGKEELRAGIIAIWTVLYFLTALIGLGCAVAADNLLGEAAGTAKRLIVSMLAAAIVVTVWGETVLYLWPWIEKEHMVFLSTLHRIAFRFSIASGWAMLLIGLYTMLQASRRATERLHQTQLAALAAERRVLEGDLRAMQGRVDPELLFDSLLEVDRCYARDVEAGQEALDALIRFLRAALPGDAAATATVADEQELAEAYLALVAQRADASPQVDISVAPEASARNAGTLRWRYRCAAIRSAARHRPSPTSPACASASPASSPATRASTSPSAPTPATCACRSPLPNSGTEP